MEGFMERQPIPGIQPGMADHAPTGWVVVGAGPDAKHRIFGSEALGRTHIDPLVCEEPSETAKGMTRPEPFTR